MSRRYRARTGSGHSCGITPRGVPCDGWLLPSLGIWFVGRPLTFLQLYSCLSGSGGAATRPEVASPVVPVFNKVRARTISELGC